MAVVIETTLGDITIDLYLKERPRACLNFLKLCKMKYYNFNLFHTVNRGFIAQTGDPTGAGDFGESIWGVVEGPLKRFFEAEMNPRIKHTAAGLVSFVGDKNNMLGSQFFITLAPDLLYLDVQHCVFGEVAEGLDILHLLNESICDNDHRPYQDIRITHTAVLEDPFPDPEGFKAPDSSPEPTAERLQGGRIAPDEDIDEMAGKSAKEIAELAAEREAKARATILEMVGDIPDAEMAPPENVLFVCKLNPVTNDDDLEIIFSRFGKIKSCEVIRDKKTGDSLQYAFVEFENEKSCEDAYFKMDNVLIDDRRIHVDFSQSVAKVKWFGKGRGVTYYNDNGEKENGDPKNDIGTGKYQSSKKKNYRDESSDRPLGPPPRRTNLNLKDDADEREYRYKDQREDNFGDRNQRRGHENYEIRHKESSGWRNSKRMDIKKEENWCKDKSNTQKDGRNNIRKERSRPRDKKWEKDPREGTNTDRRNRSGSKNKDGANPQKVSRNYDGQNTSRNRDKERERPHRINRGYDNRREETRSKEDGREILHNRERSNYERRNRSRSNENGRDRTQRMDRSNNERRERSRSRENGPNKLVSSSNKRHLDNKSDLQKDCTKRPLDKYEDKKSRKDPEDTKQVSKKSKKKVKSSDDDSENEVKQKKKKRSKSSSDESSSEDNVKKSKKSKIKKNKRSKSSSTDSSSEEEDKRLKKSRKKNSKKKKQSSSSDSESEVDYCKSKKKKKRKVSSSDSESEADNRKKKKSTKH